MSAPVAHAFQLTTPGTSGHTGYDDLRYVNDHAYGPLATAVTATTFSGSGTNLDFGNDQAGNYGTPIILLLMFENSTVSGMQFSLYDALADITGGTEDMSAWFFKIKIYQNWVDPTQLTGIGSWDVCPLNSNTTYPLDGPSGYMGTGNQNGAGPTVQSLVNSNWYWSNFYIYLAMQPASNAQAGLHNHWGYRVNYIYPGS